MHNHYIENMFELEGLQVRDMIHEESRIVIKVSSVHTTGVCPHCGCVSSRIHDYRWQNVKHSLVDYKIIVLSVRKKRFTCPHCSRHFTEHLEMIGRYQRMTYSFIRLIWRKLAEIRSMSHIASECHLSWPTLLRVSQRLIMARKRLPAVLCIDEFKGNANGEKFLCSLVNAETNEIVDILPSRKLADLDAYFSNIAKEEREEVRCFVSDMYANYATLAKKHFPNAIIVADKFHFSRQCSWALENVRKNAQKTMSPKQRKYYKRSKSIMRKNPENLKQEEIEQLIVMIEYSDELKVAYRLKLLFREFLNSKDMATAEKALDRWIHEAITSGLKEFEECIKTMKNWREPILNAFHMGFTNGITEGFNNKIKVIKRISFGFRNFNNFRQRILYCCA